MPIALLSRTLETPVSVPAREGSLPLLEPPGFPGVVGTFMGRDALSLAVSYLNLGGDDTVLLPAYTCIEVQRPFLKRTRVIFYDLGPDLSIDPDEIRIKTRRNKVKILLITNYFGFLQPHRNELRQICDDRGICLIEDCAHSLLTDGSADTGDLSIYSFRKILPIPDGGGLKVKNINRELTAGFKPRPFSDVLSVLIMAKSALNIHSRKLNRSGTISRFGGDSRPSKALHSERTLPLSHVAQRKMTHVSHQSIIEKCRNDFLFWQRVTAGSAVCKPIFPRLPQGICPYGFPIITTDRSSLEVRVRQAGIGLTVHWRLEAALAPECTSSHRLSSCMATLPLYPHLRETERAKLVKLVS